MIDIENETFLLIRKVLCDNRKLKIDCLVVVNHEEQEESIGQIVQLLELETDPKQLFVVYRIPKDRQREGIIIVRI